jgi:phage I-like protein
MNTNTLADYLKDGWFKFLRKGIFLDSKGRTWNFDEAKLTKIESINSNLEEPVSICLGHPKDNKPAKGAIDKIKKVGNFLLAKPKKIAKDFAEKLKSGEILFVSASMNPETFKLNHIGLVDDPAIKGLGQFPAAAYANFSTSEDDEILLSFEFAQLDEVAVDEKIKTIGDAFQKIREFLIEMFGMEKADKAIPHHVIDFISEYSVLKDESTNFENNDISGEEPGKEEQQLSKDKKTPEKEPVQTPPEPSIDFSAKYEAEKDRADLAEKKAAELETKIAEDARKQREEKVIEFCAKQVTEGRLLPKEKEGMQTFLMQLDPQDSIEFSAGTEKQTPVEFMQTFVSGLPKRVPLDPLPIGGKTMDDDIEFSEGDVDQEDLEDHKRAKAIQAEKKCTYAEALAEVRKRR